MVRAVFFDLDGTLVNSLPGLFKGVEELVQKRGYPEISEEALGTMVGKGIRNLVTKLMQYWSSKGADLTNTSLDELVSELIEIWSKLGSSLTTLFPGVREALYSLKDQGLDCVLITNKDGRLTHELLSELKLTNAFKLVVTGSDTQRLKPAPDMLNEALEKLGLEPKEAVMVGDSVNDALAARAAGVTAILVRGGYNEGMPIDDWARENGFKHLTDSAVQAAREILHSHDHD